MKAIEHNFHVVPFIMLYKVVRIFHSVDKTPLCDYSMKAIEQYFHVVLCIMLCKLVPAFTFMYEILVSEH